MKARIIVGMVILLGLVGCNTYKVKPLPYDKDLRVVHLVNNPQTIMSGFESTVEDAFIDRGFTVQLVDSVYVPKPDEYSVRYSARRSWCFVRYLSDADIRIYKGNILVARGHYHHVGRSLSLDIFTKWRSVEWKMEDLYDELFKNYTAPQ